MIPPVILTSAYLPPVQYFTKLYGADYVLDESFDTYVKQTYRNRCVIAGPNGALSLTIPVEHDGLPHPRMRDMRISDHGNWRHLHWTAFVSAYENSPYFPYYADDFRLFYERRYKYLFEFNEALRAKICELLSLKPDIRPTRCYVSETPVGVLDLREKIRPKLPYVQDPYFRPAMYYQVFSERCGFLPNLSIVDLLFNMGPEARLVLRDSICRP